LDPQKVSKQRRGSAIEKSCVWLELFVIARLGQKQSLAQFTASHQPSVYEADEAPIAVVMDALCQLERDHDVASLGKAGG